jgi:hypothetical protein
MDDQTGQISLKTILAVFRELKSGRHAALAPATNSNQLCTTENAEFGVLGRKRLNSQLTLISGGPIMVMAHISRRCIRCFSNSLVPHLLFDFGHAIV